MKTDRSKIINLLIESIAFIELSLGLITMVGLILYPIFSLPPKPHNVLIFVLVSAMASMILGYRLLKRKEFARRSLVFFAAYIILTKILLFTGLIELKGEFITAFPSWFKNSISFLYHLGIIGLLENNQFKQEFR